MSASDQIREYARKHVIFGSDEIRALHGDKPALLVTRLAAKGEFIRIRNGVFGPAGTDENHPAYQNYLVRIHEARVERSKLPNATMADRLFTWAAARSSFSIPEASAEFGQDMKGTVAPYVKRGVIERVGVGEYAYQGPKPAARREAQPMAEERSPDHDAVIEAIGDKAMTASDLSAATGIETPRMRSVLARLVHDGRLLYTEPASTNAHRVYRRPAAEIAGPDDDGMALLAIIAASGGISTRAAATHKVGDTPRIIQNLLAAGLVTRMGSDDNLGGAIYNTNGRAMAMLADAGYGIVGSVPESHRPIEREVLTIVAADPGIGYLGVHAAMKREMEPNQVEITALRLVKAGLLCKAGKPVRLEITPLGRAGFA